MHSSGKLPSLRPRKHLPLLALVMMLAEVQANPANPAPPQDALSAVEDTDLSASQGEIHFAPGMGLEDDGLESLRGGTITLTRVDQKGLVHGNSTSHVNSGSNTITQGSFANSSGLPTVIQNTGSSVLIQLSTTVQVKFN